MTRERTPIVLRPGVYVVSWRILSRSYAFYGATLGVVLLAGGPARFGAPALAVAREAPGGRLTWGAIAVTAGAAMAVGSFRRARRLLAAATLTLVGWHLFFAITIAASVPGQPAASLTGVPTYAWNAVVGYLLHAALRQGEDRAR